VLKSMENLSQGIKSAMLYSSFTLGAISYPFQYASYSPSDVIPSENLKSQYIRIEMSDFKELQGKVVEHEVRLKEIETKLDERLKSVERILGTKLDERFNSIEKILETMEKNLKNIESETKKIASLETDIRWIKRIGGFLVGLIISAICAIGGFIWWLFKNGYLQITFNPPHIK